MSNVSNCRVCGSSHVKEVGAVEFVAGFRWTVSDCMECGCRFTRHDEFIHERLHATGTISYYGDYRELAARCQALFVKGERDELKKLLCQTSKYSFIIQRISREPMSARLLEIGASRGYLTAGFILEGRQILGVDVSAEAVRSACDRFGNHFVLADDPKIQEGRPYDLIYHVGMIGCVADPVGSTRNWLSMLRPGGKLIFNAPNLDALHLRRQLWLDSAPPPDLVTLFPRGFWSRQFGDVAEVEEHVEVLSCDAATRIGLRKIFARRWNPPVPKALDGNQASGHAWHQDAGTLWRVFERIVLKAGRLSRLTVLAPVQPTDFGLFITMIRK